MQQHIMKSAMFNGLIVGGLLSVKFLLSTQKQSIFTSLALLISISIIVVLYSLAKQFRDKECDETITYKQSFSYIFRTYLYGAIISSFVMFLYTKFVDPSLLDQLLNELLKMYSKINFKLDDKSISFFETVFKPVPYALFNIAGSAINGAFWGLILAAFIKKNKNIFSQQ